jgi:flagellar motor switch protein FliN/FliY
MPDDIKASQQEIEALLHAAKAEAGGEPAPASPALAAGTPSPAAKDALDPDEIEALVRSAGKTALAEREEPMTMVNPSRPPPALTPGHDLDVGQGDIDLLLHQAEAALASVHEPSMAAPGVLPFRLREFSGSPPTTERTTLELIRDVELDLKIELGRTQMPLQEVLKLRKGSVVPLDKLAGDPVDSYVNGRLFARGEVLVLNDNFCVRVAELISGDAA